MQYIQSTDRVFEGRSNHELTAIDQKVTYNIAFFSFIITFVLF